MFSVPNELLLVITALMTVTTAVAVVTSYYLYRWRRIISAEGRVLAVPEELIARLSAISAELRNIESAVVETSDKQLKSDGRLSQQFGSTQKDMSQLLETTLILQNALDQKDSEIHRLRQGYDAELFRRFIARFIRVKHAINDTEAAKENPGRTLDQVRRLLDDALDECGVEEFVPSVGEDFRTAVGVADSPRVIETQDPGRAFQIVDILAPGYRFRNGPGNNVIVPSRVSVFVVQRSGA